MPLLVLLVAGLGFGVGIGHFMGGAASGGGPSGPAYLQESGSGYYQTEDGSGVYLQE